MLRITVELVPGGHESHARVIARGVIENASNLSDLSSYDVKFEENSWQGKVYGPYSGTLNNWPRNERGAWDIVSAALKIAVPAITASKKQRRR